MGEKETTNEKMMSLMLYSTEFWVRQSYILEQVEILRKNRRCHEEVVEQSEDELSFEGRSVDVDDGI